MLRSAGAVRMYCQAFLYLENRKVRPSLTFQLIRWRKERDEGLKARVPCVIQAAPLSPS